MPRLRYRFRGHNCLRLEAMSDADLERFMESCGHSAVEAERRSHRCHKWIARLLRDRGLGPRLSDHIRPLLSKMSGEAMARVWVECHGNLSDAAERLGVHLQTLRRELRRRYGFAGRPGKRTVASSLSRDLLHRWHVVHGVPLRTIARKFGFVTGNPIQRRCRMLGVPVRQDNWRPRKGHRLAPLPFSTPEDFHLPPAEIERAEMERVLKAAAGRAEQKLVDKRQNLG